VPHPIRAVIFDLDGTLVASAGEIADALNAALAEEKLPALSHEQVAAMVGRGVRMLVERALVELDAQAIDHERMLASFQRHYAANVGTEARLFDGVSEGLQRLRATRVRMATVTNKPRAFTLKLLQRLGVAAFFDVIVCGDDGVKRKPAPDMLLAACRAMGTEPGGTLMVGDSTNDVAAARAAGCRVWCVPYGYNEGRPSSELDCDRHVETIEQAARLVVEGQ
jgi:phosphoglycolate phosphatase